MDIKKVKLEGITCYGNKCYAIEELKEPLIGMKIIRGQIIQTMYSHIILVFNPKSNFNYNAGTYELWLPATLLSSGGGFLHYEVIVPQLDENTARLGFIGGEVGHLTLTV